VGGAPAASGGGRRGCPAGEVGARLGLGTRWRARAGARKGGGQVGWARSRPEPQLTVAAKNGAGGSAIGPLGRMGSCAL
jgi:hypothetical protein